LRPGPRSGELGLLPTAARAGRPGWRRWWSNQPWWTGYGPSGPAGGRRAAVPA